MEFVAPDPLARLVKKKTFKKKHTLFLYFQM